jgi:hypothetical protein
LPQLVVPIQLVVCVRQSRPASFNIWAFSRLWFRFSVHSTHCRNVIETRPQCRSSFAPRSQPSSNSYWIDGAVVAAVVIHCLLVQVASRFHNIRNIPKL